MAEDFSNGYFSKPCKKRKVARAQDIKPDDFDITAAVTGSGPFNITLSLKPKSTFTDVNTMVNASGVNLFDSLTGESVGTLAGPVATGAPNQLNFAFTGIVGTPANADNRWKVRINTLNITGKGATPPAIALTNFEKSFPSPL